MAIQPRYQHDPGLEAIIETFGPEDIPWQGGQRLFEWWLTARGSRRYPAREDFDPARMGRYLSTMVLHDVEPDAPVFRIRLVGTLVVDLIGRDPTGLAAGDLPNSGPMVARYRWAVAHRAPYMCLDLPIAWASKDYMAYSTLVLPLGPDDATVNMLIANIAFQRHTAP